MRPLPILLLLTVCAALGALEDPTAKLEAMDKAAAAQKATYLRAWLAKANLEAIPVPGRGADPKASEVRAAEAAERVNNCLAGIRQFKNGPEFNDDKAVLGHVHTAIIQAVVEAETLRKAGPGSLAGNR